MGWHCKTDPFTSCFPMMSVLAIIKQSLNELSDLVSTFLPMQYYVNSFISYSISLVNSWLAWDAGGCMSTQTDQQLNYEQSMPLLGLLNLLQGQRFAMKRQAPFMKGFPQQVQSSAILLSVLTRQSAWPWAPLPSVHSFMAEQSFWYYYIAWCIFRDSCSLPFLRTQNYGCDRMWARIQLVHTSKSLVGWGFNAVSNKYVCRWQSDRSICSSLESTCLIQARQSGSRVMLRLVQTWPCCGGSGMNIRSLRQCLEVLNLSCIMASILQSCYNNHSHNFKQLSHAAISWQIKDRKKMETQLLADKYPHNNIAVPIGLVLMSSPYPLPNRRLQTSKLEGIFNQVSINIRQLLDNLNYIYQSHGINYSVSTYFLTLLKLLSPVQLLCQPYHSNPDFKTYNFQNKFSGESRPFNNQPINFQEPNGGLMTSNPSFYHPTLNFGEACVRVPKSQQFSSKQKQGKRMQATKDDNLDHASKYSKTSLNLEEEKKICSWIKDQISMGKTVTKGDIMFQAKEISRDIKFQASSGWCRRFLMRNEDARVLLQMNRYAPRSQLKQSDNGGSWSNKIEDDVSAEDENIKLGPFSAEEEIEWESIHQDKEQEMEMTGKKVSMH